MQEILIGIDVGTSALKAIAVRADTGAVAASASREYPLYTDRPRWAEQDGEDFARAANDALSELATKLDPKSVRAVGLTGQMHSAMLLDSSRALVRRAMLWCDTRTDEECRTITASIGLAGLRRTVKNLALEGFTLPKLLWLRAHEPKSFERIRTVVMPKDFVGFRLTGELQTDVSDASGTLLFDPEARTWSGEMIFSMSLDRSWFPPAEESATVLGALQHPAFPRVPVIRGGADNAVGAVGLGVVRAGRAMASIGTSGVVLTHTDRLLVDPEMRLHAFCASVPQRAYLMGSMLSAGGALRWFRDVVAKKPYEEISALAATAPRGAGGVLFLPYLMGERTPHNDALARAAFVGMTAQTTDGHLARAVLEGISFGLADSLALMRALDLDVRELRLAGGGAKSAPWRRILADVFGAEVVITNSTEGPAFGAAILAGVGAKVFGSVEEAADALVRVTDRTSPDPNATKEYADLHAQFRGLYGDLRSRFRELPR